MDTIEAWFRQLVSGCVIDEVIFFFYNHKLQDVEPICFYTSFFGSCSSLLKFMFSKKSKKIDDIFTVDLMLCSECQIDCEDFVNFGGLLRKYEL